LTHDEVRAIARHYLAEIEDTLVRAGKRLRVEDDALEKLVATGYSLQYGARFLKRVIDEQIKLPISERWKEASNFDVVIRDGRLMVEVPGSNVRFASSAVA